MLDGLRAEGYHPPSTLERPLENIHQSIPRVRERVIDALQFQRKTIEQTGKLAHLCIRLLPRPTEQVRGGGRRARHVVRGERHERYILIVADARDHRHRKVDDLAHERLVVERLQ